MSRSMQTHEQHVEKFWASVAQAGIKSITHAEKEDSDRVIETARQVGIDVWFWLPGSDE